jgi:HK97 family phage portal protein
MNFLTRVTMAGRALLGRASYLDELSPWSSKVDHAFTIVRGGEPQQYTKQGRTVREQGFQNNPIVLRCASIVADQIAAASLQAYRMNRDGVVELQPSSPLQQLLDQPSDQLPGFTFRRLLAIQLVIYGNGYCAIERAGTSPTSRPVRLRSVHPERLQQIWTDVETGEITHYVWTDGAGRQRKTAWSDMIHARDLIVEPDQWFGFPRAASALASIATDAEGTTYVRQVVTNSGVPPMIVIGEDGTEKEDLDAAEERFHEKIVKRGRRGRAAFMANVKDIKVIGHTLKDLEFPSLRGITREDICAAFGVDPRLVGAASAKGSESAMSGGQYQEARRKLEQLTCAPLRMAIVEAIDSTLSPSYGYTYTRFDPDTIGGLLETPTEVVARATKMLEAGATLEESRRAMGLPEAMDPTHHTTVPSMRSVQKAIELSEQPPMLPGALGGDPNDPAAPEGSADAETSQDDDETSTEATDPAFSVGARVVALANHMPGMQGMAGAVAEANAGAPPYYAINFDEPMGKGNPHRWLTEDEIEAEDAATEAHAMSRGASPKRITSRTGPTSRAIRGGATLTQTQRATLWRAADARATALEPAYRDKAATLFVMESLAVAGMVDDAAGESRALATRADEPTEPGFYTRLLAALAAYYGLAGAARAAWERAFLPEISLTMLNAASEMAAELGVSFDLANPRVTEAVRGRVTKLSGNVADTTLRQLRAIIAAGREAGQSPVQVAQAIRAGVFDPAITARRAGVIARTETMGALNEGEWLAAVESGVMQSKAWLRQPDSKVRDTHVACAEQGWVAMTAPFSNGLQYPHDPTGSAEEVVECRCALAFSDLPPAEAQTDTPMGATP